MGSFIRDFFVSTQYTSIVMFIGALSVFVAGIFELLSRKAMWSGLFGMVISGFFWLLGREKRDTKEGSEK